MPNITEGSACTPPNSPGRNQDDKTESLDKINSSLIEAIINQRCDEGLFYRTTNLEFTNQVYHQANLLVSQLLNSKFIN